MKNIGTIRSFVAMLALLTAAQLAGPVDGIAGGPQPEPPTRPVLGPLPTKPVRLPVLPKPGYPKFAFPPLGKPMAAVDERAPMTPAADLRCEARLLRREASRLDCHAACVRRAEAEGSFIPSERCIERCDQRHDPSEVPGC